MPVIILSRLCLSVCLSACLSLSLPFSPPLPSPLLSVSLLTSCSYSVPSPFPPPLHSLPLSLSMCSLMASTPLVLYSLPLSLSLPFSAFATFLNPLPMPWINSILYYTVGPSGGRDASAWARWVTLFPHTSLHITKAYPSLLYLFINTSMPSSGMSAESYKWTNKQINLFLKSCLGTLFRGL
jgi:hypothetical protein